MGSDHLGTELGAPYARQPETLAAAVARVKREPDPEYLLQVLGLEEHTDRPPRFVVRNGRSYCVTCDRRVPVDGYCRRPACGDAR